MTKPVFIFEFLPNELLLELFKYLQAPELFQAFYNLNSRFNHLIHSLTHLTYSSNQTNHHILSYPHIRTLIINTNIIDKLYSFPNIRRLILDYVTDDFLSQFNGYILPNLEHLSIHHRIHPFYMPDLRTKIFSNTFPNLKSCYISRMQLPSAIEKWTQSVSLRFLSVNDINALIYTSILLVCPNLYSFKCKLPVKSPIQSNFIVHTNLRRLIINMNYDDCPWDDSILAGYLVCVPNLEQFRIRRSIAIDSNVMHYLQCYDWLSSIMSSHLSLLYRFKFDLYVNRSRQLIPVDLQNICCQLKKKFNHVYKGRYQSRLVVF